MVSVSSRPTQCNDYEVDGLVSVEQGLDKYLQEDTVVWSCEKCAETNKSEGKKDVKGIPNAQRKSFIEKGPTVLVIGVGRTRSVGGEEDNLRKVKGHVRFKETLDIQPFMNPRCEDKRTIYRLKGVAEHIGTPKIGHYIAYVRSGESWFFTNDVAPIREVTQDDVLSCEVYLLFYERVGDLDPPPPSLLSTYVTIDPASAKRYMTSDLIADPQTQHMHMDGHLEGGTKSQETVVKIREEEEAEAEKEERAVSDSEHTATWSPHRTFCNEPFDKAKSAASCLDKWLLINLQSTQESSSDMLNKNIWGNEVVANLINSNFIFWQVDPETMEGAKVCTEYNLESFPAILLINPFSGQNIRDWYGMVDSVDFSEIISSYLDKTPEHHQAPQPPQRSSSMCREVKTASAGEDEAHPVALLVDGSVGQSDRPEEENGPILNIKPPYPPLLEEPKGGTPHIWQVEIRLPNGSRISRNFLHIDPIKLLWSFCYPKDKDGDKRAFHFVQIVRTGKCKHLEFGSDLTFKDAQIANSTISLLWD